MSEATDAAAESDATVLARATVAALVACGVRQIVLCPGSRSAALAYAAYDAAAAGALTLHVRHDERVAGFTALGMGAASGEPAAVITTSGTAVANLHPAVLEAHHAGVPLLVLAADRPPRLRGTWANQTSDLQAGMFGAATRLTLDLRPDQGGQEWAAAVRDGVAAALGLIGSGRPGPVQLNLGFDEPLVPGPERSVWHPAPGSGPEMSRNTAGSAPESAAVAVVAESVVVAGDRAGERGRQLAERLGLPLLAEPSSGSRSGPNAIGPYRLLLDDRQLGGRVRQAVVLGRPTLSRPVTRLLARPDVQLILLPDHDDEPGPERPDVRRVRAQALASGRPGPWLQAWQQAGAAATRAIDEVLDAWPGLSGPTVAREIAAATEPDQALVAAASNPVRDLDLAARPWAHPRLVHANRGLSGIDGTISTAAGFALAVDRPTRVLVGDVAFLHDLGALVLGPGERRPDLTVVVLNDGGGGIFSLLEQGAEAERDARAAARFERLFGTPHSVDVSAVCRGLGIPYARADDLASLRAQLASRPSGLRVLEVPVTRSDLRPLHAQIARAVAGR